MSPAEREACILDALSILPAIARRTGVASIRHPVADTEDYLQVGAEAIVRVADRYDPHRGAAFNTFAWRAAHDEMLTEARRLRWRHQAAVRPDRVLWSLDVPVGRGMGRGVRRLRGHNDDLPEGYEDVLPDDTAETPGAALEAAETQAALHAAVDRLPPPQRDAVRLYYLNGLDQAEVGRRLGITQHAVSMRLTAARAALRKTLTAKGAAA